MQRVRQPVFDCPSLVLPSRGVVDPIVAEGDVGPRADPRETPHQGTDVAIGPVQTSQPFLDPVGQQASCVSEQMQCQVA